MCPMTREEYGNDSSMWYVDDPRPLTDRRNWTPTKLNPLLQRDTAVCSKLNVNFKESNISLYDSYCFQRIRVFVLSRFLYLNVYSTVYYHQYDMFVFMVIPNMIIVLSDMSVFATYIPMKTVNHSTF